MTIPDVGRCLGSDEPPRAGIEKTEDDRTTGVCVACSGRFEVEDGRVVAHEAAPDDERESVGDEGEYRGPDPEREDEAAGKHEDQSI